MQITPNSVSEAESHQVNIPISICCKEVLGTAQTKEDGKEAASQHKETECLIF